MRLLSSRFFHEGLNDVERISRQGIINVECNCACRRSVLSVSLRNLIIRKPPLTMQQRKADKWSPTANAFFPPSRDLADAPKFCN